MIASLWGWIKHFWNFFLLPASLFGAAQFEKSFQKWGKPCGFPKLNFWQISAYCMQPWTRTHYSDDAKTIHKAEQNCPLWLIKGIHQELWGCLKSPYFNFQASQPSWFQFFIYVYILRITYILWVFQLARSHFLPPPPHLQWELCIPIEIEWMGIAQWLIF